jgi:hypothetical protein
MYEVRHSVRCVTVQAAYDMLDSSRQAINLLHASFPFMQDRLAEKGAAPCGKGHNWHIVSR